MLDISTMSENPSNRLDHKPIGYFEAQRRFFVEIFENRRIVLSVFRHNYIYLHKDTWLGVVWIFVNPCIPIFIYNVLQYLDIFSSNYNGIPRAVFLTLSLILYYAFSESLNGFTSFLSLNRTFLMSGGTSKSAVILATFLVPMSNFSIRLLLLALILWGNGTAIDLNVLYLPVGCFLLMLLGASVGLFLSVFNLISRDIANLVSMMSFYLLFASGIFGTIEPTNSFLQALMWSPVYIVLEGVRQLVFFALEPSGLNIAVGILTPIVLFSFSITAFYRVEYRINSFL